MTTTAPPPKDQVNYAVGRDMVQTGDIVSFFTSHEESALHRVTTESILYFTGSRIYHTGVAIWMRAEDGERRLMVCEAVGAGRRLVNMSRFEDHKMEIHHLPAGVDRRMVVDFMLDDIGRTYGFWNLIAIGIREFFGAKVKNNENTQVCSETAARAWQAGGMKFDTTVLSPGKLRNVLSEKGVPPTLMINPWAGE